MNWVPREEYFKNLPRKRMGAGAIFLNEKNQVLLVKPSYKDHWSIPGGVVDKLESPKEACEREIKEEIGLDVPLKQLLAVTYNHEREGYDENLQWIFDGGVLEKSETEKIKIDDDEILEWEFVDLDEVNDLVNKNFRKRMEIFLKAKNDQNTYYLEDWEEL